MNNAPSANKKKKNAENAKRKTQEAIQTLP